jgi:hypothetical protein
LVLPAQQLTNGFLFVFTESQKTQRELHTSPTQRITGRFLPLEFACMLGAQRGREMRKLTGGQGWKEPSYREVSGSAHRRQLEVDHPREASHEGSVTSRSLAKA